MKKRYLLAACLLLLTAALCGCAGSSQPAASPETVSSAEMGQKLPLSVTVDGETGFVYPLEEEGGEDGEGLFYLGVREVTIDLGGSSRKLEEAIRDGGVSAEQLVGYARMDAAAGLCREDSATENGLTRFTYQYPGFDLVYIYDVFEMPAGGTRLISEFGICESGSDLSFFYVNEETGRPIDYEDWGLDVTISQVSPAGIALSCAQSGGQQIGTLVVTDYSICTKNPDDGSEEPCKTLDQKSHTPLDPAFSLTMGGTTELSLDFSESYGELPAGNYVLYLDMEDQYSPEDLHPLMKNFRDRQRYSIPFTIE